MARFFRIGSSFVGVVIAYWLYAWTVVPLVEPPATRWDAGAPSQVEREWAARRLDLQIEALQGLFPAGAWELTNPKILESDQVKLLLRDYVNLGDGRVEIRPCTIIFTPRGPAADEAERRRRSIILEAPEGARLEFDEAFDLRQAKIGRLVSGDLVGQITIRSQGKSLGPEDDLRIVTRNVNLTEERIWTSQAVEFRLGPNYGRGAQMHINFLPGDEAQQAGRRGPNVAGVEWFELRRLDVLHLEPASMPERPPGSSAHASGFAADTRAPVEVACQGRFRFEPVRQVATFENNVSVLVLYPNGPSDQLQCELLSIYFARPRREEIPEGEKSSETAKLSSVSLDLQPRRIEARGRPVVVVSPTRDVDVRGERLEYDLQSEEVYLEGAEEVSLRKGPHEIHARSVRYQSAGAGRVGRVTAQGPGWLRGQVGDGFGEQLTARWTDLLLLQPYEGEQVISLTSRAELNFAGIGQLNADAIHFYLHETPAEVSKKTGEPPLRPHRMLAQRNVQLASPQMSGAVDELNVWFEPLGPVDVTGASLANQASTEPPRAGAATVAGTTTPVSPAAQAMQSMAGHHFEVHGDLIQGRVGLRPDRSELLELRLAGTVQLAETRTAQPGERPLVVRGDEIYVMNAASPHAEVVVSGRPARFEARGLGMTGNTISLNRGTNRLWIDGDGRMDLPLEQDLEGRPLERPVPLTVHWQRNMEFDGRTVSFHQQVFASGGNQQLRTETLGVTLREPIRFAEGDLSSSRDAQVELLSCSGGVNLQSRTVEAQETSSSECLDMSDLTVNVITGETFAHGPGTMTTVRRGTFDPMAAHTVAGMPNADHAAPPESTSSDGLTYLNVRFQGQLNGNLRRREIAFERQVRTVYGPVQEWDAVLDPDKPESLGPRGLLLDCDRLVVREMPVPLENRRSVELEADGNVLVESSGYYARAPRMTYAQGKDLLILEGNGRSDAELYHQQVVGGPVQKASARRILYWPSTRHLQTDGARQMELSRLPGR